jgi:hypothetical protein
LVASGAEGGVTADEVAREITRRAWAFGVAVVLSPDEHVISDGLRVSGYFDAAPEVPILAVAWGMGADRRLGILLHEYCHLTQWAEDAPVWRNDRGNWADWLAGKSIKNIKGLIAAARELEADCERRTIRLIRELDAPVDVENYARGANAYIHFYNVMAEKRKWYRPGRRPYTDPDSLAAANPTLDTDFRKTPKALRAAIENCL